MNDARIRRRPAHRPARRAATLVALAAVALALGACASTGGRAAEAPPAAEPDPRTVPVVSGRTGALMPWAELVRRAARADAVLLAELHGHPLGLPAAAALFEDVLTAPGSANAALSMEFYERDHQLALDDHAAGLIDDEAFRLAAARTPGNDPAGHRAMVDAARAAGRPVLAANAPRRYVRLARVRGLDALDELSEEQRRLVETPRDVPGLGDYRDNFFRVMGAMGGPDHAMSDEAIGPFYDAQSVWDATMADTVADAMGLGLRPVFHVAGAFHIVDNGGLTVRLERRAPDAEILTVAIIDEPLTDPDEHRGSADVLLFVGDSPPSDPP